MLRAIRNVLHGTQRDDWENSKDTSPLVSTAFGLLLALLLVFGFAPSLLTKGIEIEVKKIVHLVNSEIGESRQLDVVVR